MAEPSGNTVSTAVWSESLTLRGPCSAGFGRALHGTGVRFWDCPRFGVLASPIWQSPLAPLLQLCEMLHPLLRKLWEHLTEGRGVCFSLLGHIFSTVSCFPLWKLKPPWVKSWKWCWLKVFNPNNVDGNSYFYHHRFIIGSDNQWNWFLWF